MNVLVGQSGGPTAVINSSLYGVVKNADNVLGMVNGIEGFLQGKVIEFDDVELLKTTPGAYLGSCRYMLPEDLDDPIYEKLFDKFNKLDIGYFLYIGGNDSMDTVSKVSRYAKKIGHDIKVIGVPKTIDNDLVLTDHTPGFGSAAKYVANTVREVIVDASVYDKPAVTIVEIMGRHAGWLTAASVLAKPDLIYLPEVNFNLDDFVSKVKSLLKEKMAVVVCVSEGINDANGKLICEYESTAETDGFGHKALSGAGKYLENYLRDNLGCKARSIELNVLQRCSAKYMSLADRDEAIAAGKFAVEQVLKGQTGYMVAFDNGCKLVDVNLVCNKEKKVPESMIVDGCYLSQEFIDYCLPLIQGDVEIPQDEHGLSKFIRLA